MGTLDVDFLERIAKLAVVSAEQQFKSGLLKDKKGYATDFVTNIVGGEYPCEMIDAAIESAVWIEFTSQNQ